MTVDAKTVLDLLVQLLFVSLLIERIVAVVWQGLGGPAEAGDVITWTRKHVAVAVIASLLVCFSYGVDFLALAMAKPADMPWVGMLLTALVLAGGSAGIRKIADAIAEAAKASKNESQARSAAARATSAALTRAPVVAPQPPATVLAVGAAHAFAAVPALPNVSNSDAQRIIDQCEAAWPGDSGDCSAFVRDVCAALGVNLQGDADAIVDAIGGAGWTPVDGGEQAKQLADAGQLVIAGLKGAEQTQPSTHGHVVVVVSGPLEHAKYPTAYWGRLGGVGEKYKGINWAWNGGDRDRVTFASRAI